MPPIPPQSPRPEPPREPFVADFSEGLETGLYLALLELIDEGLIITGDEVMIDANSAACRLLERDYRQIVGKPLSDLFPDERAFLDARERLLIQGEMRGSVEVALPGGRRRDMRFIAAARLRPGMHALILSPDIIAEAYGRDHAGAEDRVWPRLAAAIEQGLVVVDEGNRIQAMNGAAHRDLATGSGDVVGRRLDELLDVQWPETHEPPYARLAGLRARVVPGPRKGWRLLLLQSAAGVPEEGARASTVEAPLELEVVMDVRANAPVGRAVAPGIQPRFKRGQAAVAHDACVMRQAFDVLARASLPYVGITLACVPDAALVARVRGELARSGVSGKQLELGFDGALLHVAGEEGDAALDELKTLGVRIALDDVGTAPLALAQIAAGRVDVLRVSASLVRALSHEAHAEAMIETLSSLAEAMNVQIRACGVRSPAERDFLAALGCSVQQGELFAQ